MQITRPSERFFVLSLAWLMLRKWLQNHTSQESDSTEDEEEELELEMWLARINAELEDTVCKL